VASIDFDKHATKAFDAIQRSVSLDAVYMPKKGGEIKLRGPFDDRVEEIDPDTERVISSNAFSFGLQLSDLPDMPVKGDKILIKDETYIVVDSREDGVPGVSTVLILHKETKT